MTLPYDIDFIPLRYKEKSMEEMNLTPEVEEVIEAAPEVQEP